MPGSIRFDLEALESVAVDGVLAANTYGVDQDFTGLSRLGLPVVEDAAYQAGRVDPEGRVCGTRGDAGVWSFNFKAMTGVGGGVVLLRSGAADVPGRAPVSVAEAARFVNYAVRAVLKHRIPSVLPGAEPPSREPGGEVRASLEVLREAGMSELQAAVALVQWERRGELAARQRANAEAIAGAVGGRLIGRPEMLPHLCPVLADSGDEAFRVRMALYERGIQTEEPYPVLWDTPNAREMARRLVLAPCNASLGRKQVSRIVSVLEREFSRRGAEARRQGAA